MTFNQQKTRQLSKKDASNIGEWDVKIKGLCEKLNKRKEYYTTSSCAGRVVLLKETGVKQPGAFLFRTHDKIKLNELKKVLKEVDYGGLVQFKQSTCILHIACLDLKSAQSLVDKAKLSGWKHSGIMGSGKRFMVELHSTEQLDFPVMSGGKILVDDDFLKLVVVEANKRLEKVWGKIERLKKGI